jgi:hypothetical protein
MDYGGEENFELSSKRNIGKLVLTLFGVFFFLILIIFFIFYSINSSKISQRDLYKGETFELKDNESLKVRFQKEKHEVDIRILGSKSVEVSVYSEPVKKRVGINESVFFDLNNDSKNDFRAWLLGIEDYKAIIEFKRVDGIFCSPNWKCERWGDCIDGLRRRKCEDLNRCGRPDDSPDTERFCADVLERDVSEEFELSNLTNLQDLYYFNYSQNSNQSNDSNKIYSVIKGVLFLGNGSLNCSDNYGNICTDRQKCNGNWINCSDSLRCCFGECYYPNFNLSGANSSITCNKNISSFWLAAYNCTPFRMECEENVLLFGLGIVQGFESVLEIKGPVDIDRCLVYYGYGEVYINYTSEKYFDLIEQGKSSAQINFEIETLEDNHIQKYQNKNMVCKVLQKELFMFANKWKNDEAEWSRDFLGKYECEGDLVGI